MNDPAKRPQSTGGEGCEIVLLNPNRYPEAAPRRLRPWLARLVAALAPAAGSLGVRFVGDRAMRRVNRQFRSLDKTTDVLSFPGEEGHLGDILISVPTARRQAAGTGLDAGCELKTLLLHGVLHCLGHDHEADQGQMERLERRLRKRWIGDGTDEAAGEDAGGRTHA
jgi:probable rRNA maturation factor